MADDLQPVGFRAVIEDLDEFVRGAEEMNAVTAAIGTATGNVSGDIDEATQGIAGFGEASEQATTRSAGFSDAIGGIAGSVQGMLGPLAGLAAGIGAAFAIEGGIDALNSLQKSVKALQQTTNLTAEDASKLTFAFDQYGISARQSGLLITRLSKNIAGLSAIEDGTRALGEGTTAADKLADKLYTLGVRTKDADGNALTLNQSMGQLADAFKNMPNGIEKTNLATQLFGRNGKDLLPLLNKGSAGLAEMGDLAEKLGLVLDQKLIDSVSKQKKAMKEFRAALQGISVQIGIAFLPALVLMTKLLSNAAIAFNQKIVPAIQVASGVLNFFFTSLVKSIGPPIAAAIDALGRAFAHLGRIFANGFIDFDIMAAEITELPALLRPVGLALFYLGAAFRKSIDWIVLFVKTVKILNAVIRAVVADQNNLLRIWRFLPKPIQDILIKLAPFVRMLIDASGAVRDFADTVRNYLIERLNALRDRFTEIGDTNGPVQNFLALATRLGDIVIPALAAAITLFIGALAVGTVLGFAQAIGGMILAFGNFGPIKILTGVLGDFLSGLAKPFNLIIDLAGNVLEGIGKVAKFLFDAAVGIVGKVFEMTVNAVGSAFDFIRGLVEGGIQGILDSRPLTQKVILETEGGLPTPGAPGVPLPEVPPEVAQGAGRKASENFFIGFFKGIGEFFGAAGSAIVGFIVGTLATFFGNRASLNGISQIAKGFINAFAKGIGLLLPQAMEESIGGALARMRLAGIFSVTGFNIAGVLIQSILAGLAFKEGDLKEGFIQLIPIITGVIGGAIGSVVPGLGTAVGFAIGAAIGQGIVLAIKDPQLARQIGVTLSTILNPASLLGHIVFSPKQAGKLVGSIGAALAIALLLSFVGAFKAGEFIGRMLQEFQQASIRFVAFMNELGADIADAIGEGIQDGAAAIGRGLVDAFKSLPELGSFIIDGIVATIKDPRKLIEAFALIFRLALDPKYLVQVLAQNVGKIVEGIVDLFTQKIPTAFVAVRTAIKNAAQDAFGLVPDLVKDILQGVIDNIVTFGQSVSDQFRDVWNRANEITDGGLQEARDGVYSAISGIASDISSLFTGIKDTITQAMVFIKDTLVGGWNFIKEGVVGIVSAMVGSITGAFSGLKASISGFIADAARLIIDFLQKVSAGLGSLDFIPGVGSLQDKIDAVINGLAGFAGQPGSSGPAPGGAVLPGLPGSGNPAFAAGTPGPLSTARRATVAESGTELALLRRGSANLPAGSEVLGTAATSRLMSMLQSLPSIAGAGGSSGDINISIPMEVDARGTDFETFRALVHAELDRQILNSRSRATRAGAPIGSMIG